MRIFGLVSFLAAISHVLAADPFSGDLEVLLQGNKAFRDNMAANAPGFLQDLADAKRGMNRLPSNIACQILTYLIYSISVLVLGMLRPSCARDDNFQRDARNAIRTAEHCRPIPGRRYRYVSLLLVLSYHFLLCCS